jgi:DNA-binding beta-propeller fold protein YncE
MRSGLGLKVVSFVGYALLGMAACQNSGSGAPPATSGANGGPVGGGTGTANAPDSATSAGARLPLVLVTDVPLPGNPVRFDYQDIDPARGHLVIAHMNDASVVVVNLSDGSVVKVLPGIPTARGIAVADDVKRIFITSSPNQLVIVDSAALTEVARITTGKSPDGVGWDPAHKTVGVSAQANGAVTLISGAGTGTSSQVPVGVETGNTIFDASRGWFWAAAVQATPPDQLVGVDPVGGKVTTRINLPGCQGAHGLRIHPDGQSAFVACENNNVLARVDLGGTHSVSTAPTGNGPDVLSIDPGLGWLYVSAESGDLTVFDINKPGASLIGHDSPGANSHSVAVDPSTHRVFFPLMAGPKGTPVLRIMRPTGI